MQIEELAKMNFKNTIDIRSCESYNQGSIPNSKNITKEVLLLTPEKYLNKSKKYYIYCSFGEKSKKVCRELNELGYNTINIIGGYNSYKKYSKTV